MAGNAAAQYNEPNSRRSSFSIKPNPRSKISYLPVPAVVDPEAFSMSSRAEIAQILEVSEGRRSH
jgi:hypothetical protein